MLSVTVQEARCLRPSCQQGWSAQRLWGRISSLRPAGLASAVALFAAMLPASCLPQLLASSRCIRPLFPRCSLAASPQWFLLSAPPPGQAVLWGAWLPCPCQDALWGVSHHEGEVTPSLRNAGLMRTAASQGLENRDQELLCHLERYQLPFPGDKDKALRFCGSSCENHLAQRVSSMVSSTQNILECPP